MSAEDVHVEVGETGGDGEGHTDHSGRIHRTPVQIIKERAVLVVVRYQPQLRPRAIILNRINKYINSTYFK